MFKILVAALLSILLMGCEDSAKRMKVSVIPAELSDCGFFEIQTGNRLLIVVRCPNSDTTTRYKVGKTSKSTTVVE